MCISPPSCIFGGTRLFTRRRKTRCQGWSHRVPCGNRQRRGFSFPFFFFGRAPGVAATAPIDSVVLPGGAHRFRRSPPRLYILITLSHSLAFVPLSVRGARTVSTPSHRRLRGPDAAAAADDDVLRAPSAAAAATPRVVHQRTQPPVRRWAAANFEAGRCFLHTHTHIHTTHH